MGRATGGVFLPHASVTIDDTKAITRKLCRATLIVVSPFKGSAASIASDPVHAPSA
jgi:hypothetical protein